MTRLWEGGEGYPGADHPCMSRLCGFADMEMPDHDLEPPRFARRALETLLKDLAGRQRHDQHR